MKFKTKEELIEQYPKHTDIPDMKIEKGAYTAGISDAFKSFVERIDFYQKYINNMELLKKEHKKLYNKWFTGRRPVEGPMTVPGYDKWLFKHCFGDLLK